MKKILVIIGTAEPAKAEAGAMYAVNALKHAWLEDVQLYFFGPAETLLLADENLQDLVRQYQQQQRTAVACRFLSDRDGTSDDLRGLGVDVQYVGERISALLNAGYIPMVW